MTTDLSGVIPTRYVETNVAVVETCSCGATFEGLRLFKQAEQLADWRKNHRHDMSAAIARVQAEAHDAEKPAARDADRVARVAEGGGL